MTSLLSDLMELFGETTFFVCPNCDCVSSDLGYITIHIKKCKHYKTMLPIVISGEKEGDDES